MLKTQHLPECPNQHLPECWAKDPSDPPAWCICDELRACEERVLNAAREAVAALPEYRMRDTCIAAIEQLREEKK